MSRDLLLPGWLGVWSVRDAKGSVTAGVAWCMEREGCRGVRYCQGGLLYGA